MKLSIKPIKKNGVKEHLLHTNNPNYSILNAKTNHFLIIFNTNITRTMERIFIIILILCSHLLNAQSDYVSFRVGGNLSKLIGSETVDNTFKPGFHFGFTSSTKITGRLYLRMSSLFNQLSFETDQAGLETKTSFNFAQLPVSLKFYLNDNLSIYVGGQINPLISAKAKIEDEKSKVTDLFQNGSVGLNSGFGYEFSDFEVNMNYYYGLTDLIKGSNLDWHLTSIEISIGRKIFQKI